ncbi:MAG TPA: hypothetical protein PJ991_03295 [Kiritimatiellia bacterium]|nr:hypothetical protein [Kiritimatiellia bacterium]
MKTFFARYLLLTREERLLIAGVLLIVIVGLWAVNFRQTATEINQTPLNGQTTSN